MDTLLSHQAMLEDLWMVVNDATDAVGHITMTTYVDYIHTK